MFTTVTAAYRNYNTNNSEFMIAKYHFDFYQLSQKYNKTKV